ncbi:MAG: MscL family protein [Clostridia bacterium]|nr:MscL family protein [Clostridia bacterium]
MGKADTEVIEARIAAGEEKERKQKMKDATKKMKEKRDGFFKDFKKFITKGNIVDMAVGVIVGSAFTAIINALSNGILKPFINCLLALILGKDSLSEVYTFLQIAYKVDETGAQVIDLANSIYIDWGTFINAIINFFLVAFTLFVIARIARRVVNKAKARELAAAKEAEEKKKAEEKAKAEAVAAAAAAKEAQLQAFYANVARQTELLEQLSKKQ